MALKIDNSALSLGLSRRMEKTRLALGRSLERLSTGRRIVDAKDDPVGLGISERLNSEIRGLTQAVQNGNQGMSALAIADGALGELTNILQSMRELAVQAANGTLSAADRTQLGDQVQGLLAEYTRIVHTTTFNGRSLLDGDYADVSLQLGGVKSILDVSIGSVEKEAVLKKAVGTGHFSGNRVVLGVESSAVRAGDLNGDGNLDLVSSNGSANSLTVQLGKGDGTFSAGETYFGDDLQDLHLADLNGDSVLDIVAASDDTSSVGVYLGNGDGTFRTGLLYSVASNTQYVTVGDMNGDGIADVVASSSYDGSIGVLIGNGDGTLQPVVTYSGPDSMYDVEVGDINGDGHLDVVAVSYDNSSVSTFLGNGDGSLQGYTSYVTTEPKYLELADFNHDEVLDIVASNFPDGSVSYFEGNGDGTFASAVGVSFGNFSGDLESGDVNGDGNLDFIVGDADDNSAVVMLGNGDGTFGFGDYLQLSSVGDRGVTLGDFDNDGVLDFVSAQSGGYLDLFLGVAHDVTALSDLALSSQTDAEVALGVIDTALESISAQRAGVGAIQNQLEAALSGVYTRRDSLAQAHSDLVDVDIALETAELVRQQVLQQAQIAVMAQANLQQAAVLELLR